MKYFVYATRCLVFAYVQISFNVVKYALNQQTVLANTRTYTRALTRAPVH